MRLQTKSKLLILTVLNFACHRAAPLQKNELRLPLDSEPNTLDPQLADTGVAVSLVRQLFSTLLTINAEQKVVPMDAASWEWRENGRALHIQIRQDLKWSDGMPLSACHYRDGILRALSPEVPSRMADILDKIRGAAGRKKGQAISTVGVRCQAVGRELVIESTQAYSAQLLYALTFVVSSPFRADLTEKQRSRVSSGAYILGEWQRDRKIILRARTEADLPADRRAHFSHIEMPLVKNPATALALYEQGALDILSELPPLQIGHLQKRPDYQRAPYYTTYMIGFSFKALPALRDPQLRQVLSLLGDQASLPNLLGGGEIEAKGWIPPGLIPDAQRATQSLANPAEAERRWAKLLQEKPAYKKLSLKLFYNGGERHQLLMERFAYLVKKHLKMTLILEPMEWKALVSQIQSSAPDLYRYAWTAIYPDALFFLELFHSQSQNNFGGWRNRAYDEIVERLAQVPLEKRDQKFWQDLRRAEDLLTREDPALIPLYHYVRHALVSSRIEKFVLGPEGLPLFKDLRPRDQPAK